MVPRIVAVLPIRDAQDASLLPIITVELDYDLDETTVVPERLYLTCPSTQQVLGVTDIQVQGRQFSFTPVPPDAATELEPQTLYQVTIAPGLKNILGYATTAAYTWPFTTGAAATLGTPSLTTPASGSRVDTLPLTFGWLAGANALRYRLQISTDLTFTTLSDELVTTELAVASAVDYDTGTYYARVRGESDDAVSAWSAPISVIYGTLLPASQEPPAPESLWLTPLATFRVLATSPEHGSSMVQPDTVDIWFSTALPESPAALPIIVLTPLAGGQPSRLTTGAWAVIPDGTGALTGLRFTPASALDSNTSYDITIPSNLRDSAGNALVGATVVNFTTSYSVLYTSTYMLRYGHFGVVSADMDDADLYYQIFLASLDVNRRLLGNSVTLSELLAPLSGSDITAGIVHETVVRAQVRILRERVTRAMIEGDTRRALGDFSVSTSYRQTEMLQDLLNSAEAELIGFASMRPALKSASLASVSEGPQPQARSTF